MTDAPPKRSPSPGDPGDPTRAPAPGRTPEPAPARPPGHAPDAAARYLELLKSCLTRELFLEEEVSDLLWWPEGHPLGDPKEVWAILRRHGWRIVRARASAEERREGRDFPAHAETMIGRRRLDHLQELATRVLAEDVPGDFVEAGVWRGGSVALLRAVLAAYGDPQRLVWACDSFEGLPEPDVARFPLDARFAHDASTPERLMQPLLTVSAAEVRSNLARYGLLDERVRFLEGWFKDTLPEAPMERIALLRVDCDLYESTRDALTHLEPRVVPGGFVVVDDYGGIDACRQATDDYRAARAIEDSIQRIDWTGVWWRKGAGSGA